MDSHGHLRPSPSMLECLPGPVKDDILNLALLRGQNLGQLKSLLHSDLKVLQTRGSNISAEDLLCISKCHQIRQLELNPPISMEFRHLSSNSINAMLSQLRCLVKLHLQRNSGVTDEVIKTLVSNSHNLRQLDVSGCLQLTDCSAEALATLPNLQALNMSFTKVSDEGLICIAKGKCALSLRELCMTHNINIRGHSLEHIVKYCKNLQILSFYNCLVPSEDLAKLDSFFGHKKMQLCFTVDL